MVAIMNAISDNIVRQVIGHISKSAKELRETNLSDFAFVQKLH